MGFLSKIIGLFTKPKEHDIISQAITIEPAEAPDIKNEVENLENSKGKKVTISLQLTYPKEVPKDYKPPENIQWSNNDNDPVEKLLKKLIGKGHKIYPLLHPTYSFYSRIPYFGLTSFIKERLLENDDISINRVLEGLSFFDGGLIESLLSRKNDINEKYSKQIIGQIKEICFADYIKFDNDIATTELSVLWFVLEMYGGERYYWAITEPSMYLSVVLACYSLAITDNIIKLVSKANQFLKECSEDDEELINYPRYKKKILVNNELPSPEFIDIFNKFTIEARIHFYYALVRGDKTDLNSCIFYKEKLIGIVPEETSKELLDSGLFEYEIKTVNIPQETYFTKNELLEIMNTSNIPFKKSWTKSKLCNTINEFDDKILSKMLTNMPRTKQIITYEVCGYYESDINKLQKRIIENKVIFDLICFIGLPKFKSYKKRDEERALRLVNNQEGKVPI